MAEIADLAQALAEKTFAAAMSSRRLPEATYRLQFHAGFTFRQAIEIVPYLADLGITHCYASPIMKAKPGSQHGYDVVDPSSFNPEVGTEAEFDALHAALKKHGIGLILDTVPNHMGVATNDNVWWNSVLENGPASRYANYFDIAWKAPLRSELQDKVLLPVLGGPYDEVLESGQLQLQYEHGAFVVKYYERQFPISPKLFGRVLELGIDDLEASLGVEHPAMLELKSIITAARNLPDRSDREYEKMIEREREKEVIKNRLERLTQEHAVVRAFVDANVRRFNGDPSDPHSFDLLDELLEHQPYRLAFWRVAPDEINYRRFFDINDLAALSIEREEVFDAVQGFILKLLAEDRLDGLRIDHPDGLYDPGQYFWRLQEKYLLAKARKAAETSPDRNGHSMQQLETALRQQFRALLSQPSDDPCRWPLYVAAEKILGLGEPLPADWPVYGTSGYDFVNELNALFVDSANADAFSRFYHSWIGDETRWPDLVYQKKMLTLKIGLASELHALARQLDRIAQKHRKSRDFTFDNLRRALQETIACFPVYRAYVTDEGMGERDRQQVEIAIAAAREKNSMLSPRLFDFLRYALLLKSPPSFSDEDREELRRFVGKFQQVTAPVTAKGIEDTAFYVYNRLVSLNEVGGDPSRFGQNPEALHAWFADRQKHWPYAMSPLSTHDTKRSEDVRARINVLSEMPNEWREAVGRWSKINEPHLKASGGALHPDLNTAYLLYQTLIGAWPLGTPSAEEHAEFVKRIQQYMEKAIHEAKVHTSWLFPNAEYDEAVREYVEGVLDREANKAFSDDFVPFQARISQLGMINSLAQTLVRIAAPGVPDTYQGTEFWDLSLVDPDNRRPVDYEKRRASLTELKTAAEKDASSLSKQLLETRDDGRIKLYLTWKAMQTRHDHEGLFTHGEYVPIAVKGSRAEHVFAFARRHGEARALVVIPRLVAKLLGDRQGMPVGPEVWGDTQLDLSGIEGTWRNVLTGEKLAPEGNSLAAASVFSTLPIALFVSD
jgi:(1->4)-alpha-D-glucan 1-alpha-D-glucosylmutase